MKNIKKYLLLSLISLGIISCSEDSIPVANDVTLEFNNTFGSETIILGDATSVEATVNTSTSGQAHYFSELKYVISNISLIDEDDNEFLYHVNDLDNGATVVNQAKTETLQFLLSDIPTANYTQIKFGLGVKTALNTLDEVSFPNFYAAAGANDTAMHWEWGTGYRFTKIEGFYGDDNAELSIHTGSTVEGEEGSYTQGVDAYREIILDLPVTANVGSASPKIVIKADFDALLSGQTNTIELGEGNAAPSIHHAGNMVLFVDNIGGNGDTDVTGMFSVESVQN
ncbi:MbnP family protein [Polaribacter sargassicola]|uniref:MbnP family protein n=1 Tax=Polaribacter sargassicola TaxID=2836891 RepID=UPI001F37A4FE|nr:MbnP family protein [Polaribacter sp. DS7-9]MCG1035609.1 hypothetical protein [Polaribacter sp. DS7-9]